MSKMSDKQVKIEIDGNLIDIEDFLRGPDKKYISEPNVYDIEKQIVTDIRNYLVAILDEWHRRIYEPNFYEQNIGVYNHIRKELDDLTEYAKKLGVEL